MYITHYVVDCSACPAFLVLVCLWCVLCRRTVRLDDGMDTKVNDARGGFQNGWASYSYLIVLVPRHGLRVGTRALWAQQRSTKAF